MSGGAAPWRLALTTLAVVAGILVVAGLGLWATIGDSGPGEADGLGQGSLPEGLADQPAPRFALPDQEGKVLDTADLRGRPYALTFLYTRCPDVCPLIALDIRAALERMGPQANDIDVLAVSVDPEGDTPPAARRFLERLRLPSNVRYLLGSRAELSPVWDAYFAAPQIPGDPETSTHTAAVWLIGPEGRLRGKYSAGAPVPPEALAEDLSTLAEEASGGV